MTARWAVWVVSLASGCWAGRIEECTLHLDADGDGVGSEEAVVSCVPLDGYVAAKGDCDDGDATAFPGAAERCGGGDEDCSGAVDDGLSPPFYADRDLDGFGDEATASETCEEGSVTTAGDCDDDDPGRAPGVEEACDGVDQDCDDETDEGLPKDTFYRDADGDGHGDPAAPREMCALGEGYSDTDDDCDDGLAAVHPGAEEVCGDGVDNDCAAGGAEACGPSGAQELSAVGLGLWGQQPDGWAGATVAGAGDTNGDGVPELLIGAPGMSVRSGAVYLVHGVDPGGESLSAAETILTGPPDSKLGGQVAAAHDVDGDGVDDLLLGGEGFLSFYVVRGPLPSGTSAVTAVASTTILGGSVFAGGDLDGDDISEIFVGDQFDDAAGPDHGVVFIVGGPVPAGFQDARTSYGARILGGTSDEWVRFGAGVAPAGDVDGDGTGDLVVGTRRDALLFRGPVVGELAAADADAAMPAGWDFAGLTTGEYGQRMAGSGDTNADGYADLLFGVPSSDPAAVWCGPMTGAPDGPTGTIRSTSETGTFGEAAAWGDVDGDGHDDVLLGEPLVGENEGYTYLMYGPIAGVREAALADVVLAGPIAAYAGGSVASPGDLDGDGYAEILVGAYLDHDKLWNSGSAFLVYGGPGL